MTEARGPPSTAWPAQHLALQHLALGARRSRPCPADLIGSPHGRDPMSPPEDTNYSQDPPPDVGHLLWSADIESTLKNKRALLEGIIESLLQLGVAEDRALRAKLCLDEALTNAIKHGNRHDSTRRVHAEVRTSQGRWHVRILDEGEGFDPTEVPDPMNSEGLMRESGRGLLLMRQFMDDVRYWLGGRCVELSQRIAAEAMHAPFEELRPRQGVVVLRPSEPGPLDEAHADWLRERLDELSASTAGGRLVLDCSPITYLADAGLALLSELQSALAGDERVHLAAISPLVREILEATGLIGAFALHEDVPSATA